MMNFEQLERAWNAPANSPGEAASAYLTAQMMDTLKKRRRAANGLVGFVGLALVFWTGRIAYEMVVAPFPFDPAREWSTIALIILPWVGLFAVTAQQRRHERAHPDPYRSIAATLSALADENGAARRRLQITTVLMIAAATLLALALHQLQAVGKMTAQNAMQAGAMFGLLLGAVAAYKAWHYLRVLTPEAARLQRLLRAYSAD